MLLNNINNISFQAKPGKELVKQLNKEFNNNAQKTDKFIKLFEQTYNPITDSATVIDIDKNNNYIFSNTNFPDIKYYTKTGLSSDKPVAVQILNECSKTVINAEIQLYRKIIAKSFQKNKSLAALKFIAGKLQNNRFAEQIKLTEQILKKNPHSHLSPVEYEQILTENSKEEIQDVINKIFG